MMNVPPCVWHCFRFSGVTEMNGTSSGALPASNQKGVMWDWSGDPSIEAMAVDLRLVHGGWS